MLISQLVLKHGLGGEKELEEAIELMYSTMGEFRLGKASTVFMNRARELGACVLSNKKNQETRFVRWL